jgi:hypothetical protein
MSDHAHDRDVTARAFDSKRPALGVNLATGESADADERLVAVRMHRATFDTDHATVPVESDACVGLAALVWHPLEVRSDA